MALFAFRSSARLSRCRAVFPDDAGERHRHGASPDNREATASAIRDNRVRMSFWSETIRGVRVSSRRGTSRLTATVQVV
jgi:hypothetical protein